jgi:FkbM family methyltransferase
MRLLSYLIAEQTVNELTNPHDIVRPGDIVMDCGAHVGVYTYFALRRGASMVVAIEPDPVNAECYRRNYAGEIAAGRVVLVEKGVWSSAGKLSLHESSLNSGSNSVVAGGPGPAVTIEVTTIDALVNELRLPAVNFIKMDIEGSEREALKGAQATLRRSKPRLMLDAYHRPDDPEVLPALLRQARGDYQTSCGCWELEERGPVPHVIFAHP